MIYKRGECKLDENGKCPKCGKRGTCGVYWYKFMWQGRLLRESTKQGNDRIARQMESAHRTSLAKGEVGIRERKPSPTLADFMSDTFQPWVEATFREKPRTAIWYRGGIRRVSEFPLLAKARLCEISAETVHAYIVKRQTDGLNITSINRELQILRRILRLAVEWGTVESALKVRLLPGEKRRERVLSLDEESRYLAAAHEPLASIASVLVDSGLRPDEAYQMRWESITWVNGRHGTFLVTHGKTAAARRVLPMTPRVRSILESRWEAGGKPLDGWIWSAPTRSGHVESSSLRKQHQNALRTSRVRPFVLYSLRHSFLTRLAESGCDVWALSRIAGHASLTMSQRYIHPSQDAVLDAIARLGGHKFGHIEKDAPKQPVATIAVSTVQ
jgi:integrase